jgi:purine nucleoside permease
MDMKDRLIAALARLTSAINAVDVKASAAAAGATINDSQTAANTVWSSTKVQQQINAAVTALVNGAGTDSDTLKELADSLTALAQADAGLVSALAAQAFNAAQKLQACQNIGIGDPDHDFTVAIAAALRPGL